MSRKRKFINKIIISLKRAFIKNLGLFFNDKYTITVIGILIIILSVINGWIGDGFQELIFGNYLKGFYLLITSGLLLFILLFIGYKILGNLDFEIYEEEPAQKKVLILFLSNAKYTNNIHEEIEYIKKSISTKEKIEKVGKSESIKNWRMPLEAINYHLSKLEKIIVITSPLSSQQFKYFRNLIEVTFNKNLEIKELKVEDFNSIKELFSKIKDIYIDLANKNYKESDIIIDITGGTKPASIAGALITSIYPNREFQYISTNNYSVKSYNIEPINIEEN